MSKILLDLARDLRAATRLGASVEAVDRLLGEAIEALGRLVPFDLATILELDGDALVPRVARGPLADARVRRHRIALESFPTLAAVLADGRARALGEHEHRDGDGDPYDGVLDLPHGHHCMVVPLCTDEGAIGLLTLDRASCGTYAPDVVALADVFGKLLALAMSYGQQSALLVRLHEQLAEQNRLLVEAASRGRADPRAQLERMTSPRMQAVARLARQVAATDTPVLITGETGTGKEVLARAIHASSPRAERPLIAVNCAALPAGLIESELFGHVRGAFSGATATRVGRFQAANGGTLFLDEVGEIPLELQAKLLRVLQEGCFEPLGSDRTVRVDVRILAATNRDLPALVRAQRFREDLYYRLAVFPIAVPPLAERREDIPILAQAFLDELALRTGRGPWRLTPEALEALGRRAFPGNVRELLNVLERATVLVPRGTLAREVLGEAPLVALTQPAAPSVESPARLPTLAESERALILAALERCNGRIHGHGGAAELLDLNPSTLRSRLKKLDLAGPRAFRRARASRPS